jgi:hypothetical protein
LASSFERAGFAAGFSAGTSGRAAGFDSGFFFVSEARASAPAGSASACFGLAALALYRFCFLPLFELPLFLYFLHFFAALK